MNRFIGDLITLYQRFLSPYKGFSCASGLYHGEGTCSMVVKEIILTQGCFRGLPNIISQFRRCRSAANELLMSVRPTDLKPGRLEQNDSDSEDWRNYDSSHDHWENDGSSSENQNVDEKKEDNVFGVLESCTLMPAACIAPDPSDCGIGGVLNSASGACGSTVEAIAAPCSCL